MTAALPIPPCRRPVAAAVRVPGSKSITNRALLLAALSPGEVALEGALFSDDTRVMVDALRALGIPVREEPAAARLVVTGAGGRIPRDRAEIFVGNAGTAARFLTALLCLSPSGEYRLDGVPAMRRRPMRGLIEALRQLGAEIDSAEGHFPIVVRPRGLRGGPVDLDASESSQLLSAILQVAPRAPAPIEVRLAAGTVSGPFVGLTLSLLRQFGYAVPEDLLRAWSGEARGTSSLTLPAAPPRPPAWSSYEVEPDATAASYFLALPLVARGSCTVRGLTRGAIQGDTAFAAVLAEAGLTLQETAQGLRSTLAPGAPRPKGGAWDFRAISDTFLTLAAVAPLLDGPTRIHGIAHTRKQETDRIAAMAEGLRRLGQEVREGADSIEIHPRPLRPAAIDTYEDHRVAMSFGVLGSHDLRGDGTPWLTVNDPACCAKTFPRFFEVLAEARGEEQRGGPA